MRLPINLVPTFFLVLSSLLPTTVLANHRRHGKSRQNAIITARQYRPQRVTRDLVDLCINLRVVLNQLPLDLGVILAGDADACLCLKDLNIYLNAKANELGVLGVTLIPHLRLLLNDILRTSGKKCTLPDHAHFVCTNTDPCHVECDSGRVRVGDQCVCQQPKKICNGQCVDSPNPCEPSAVPRPLLSRRNEITTLDEAQRYCGAMEVCGIPSATSRNAFECVDTTSDPHSCGGCVHPNPWMVALSGKDCTTSKALKVTCKKSRCVVDLCRDGFETNDSRDACVPATPKTPAFRRASVSNPTMIDFGRDNGVVTDLSPSLNNDLTRLGGTLAPSIIHPLGSTSVSRISSSCPPPQPHIPNDPPSTLSGLLVLFGNISTIGKSVGDFGELLGSKCNCHDSSSRPPHPHAPLLKSVVDLVLKVDVKLNLLANDPTNIDVLVGLLNRILTSLGKCLKTSDLADELRGILAQLEDEVHLLLKGVKLIPGGIVNCGCKKDFVSSLFAGAGLKKRSALRRGVACAEVDASALSNLQFIKRSLINLDLTPLGLGGSGVSDAGPLNDPVDSHGVAVLPSIVHPVDSGHSTPYPESQLSGDPSAPVDVDLNCLGLKGINGEVIAGLGDGLNKPLNEVLSILAPIVHPANIHPCIKPCSGGGESGSGSNSQDSPPSKSTGSTSASDEGSCPLGLDYKGDPSAPVDVDLSCLGLKGVDGNIIANLGAGLNKPLNEVLGILSPVVHSADVYPCIKSKPCNGGDGNGHNSGSGSKPSKTCVSTSGPTTPPSTGSTAPTSASQPVGPSGSNSGSSGSCPSGSNGPGDPAAPVDVDLDCLRINGVSGDVIINLGSGLNKSLNKVLGILSPVVHPANIQPCIKAKPCNGEDGSASEITRSTITWSRSASSKTPPPTKTPSSQPSGPTRTGSGSAETCSSDSDTKGDPSAPVDIDLNCLKLKGVNGEIIVNLGTGLNKPLNEVLGLLSPIVHPDNIQPCIKVKPCNGGNESWPSRSSSSAPRTKTSPSGEGSDPSGSCPGSGGDPTAPIDVDLDCLKLSGVNGQIIASLGTGLNKPLNELLGILSPIVHPANIQPCIKPKPCNGGKDVSESDPSKTGDSNREDGSTCQKCTGGLTSGDPSHAVVIDLNCIGINAVVTVDLGSEINQLLNGLLDGLLNPIVRPASSRRSESSASVDVLKSTLNESVTIGSSMANAAKVLYKSCGCKDTANSKILLTIAVTAKLKTSLDKLQVDLGAENTRAALNAVRGLLAVVKSCKTIAGLEDQLAVLTKGCEGLIPKLETLLDGF